MSRQRPLDLLDDRLRVALKEAGYRPVSVLSRRRERGQERGRGVYEQPVKLSTHPGHAFVLRLHCAPPSASIWGHSLGVYAASLFWQVQTGELLLVGDIWEDSVEFTGMAPWFVSHDDEWTPEQCAKLVALESYGSLFPLRAARCAECGGPCPQKCCWRALPSPTRAPDSDSSARRGRKPKVPLTNAEVEATFASALAEKSLRGPRDALLLAVACALGGTSEELVALQRSALETDPDHGLVLDVEGEKVLLPLSKIEFDWGPFLQAAADTESPFLFLSTARGGREFDTTNGPVISVSAASRAIRSRMLEHAHGAGIADLHYWWHHGTLGEEDDEAERRRAELIESLGRMRRDDLRAGVGGEEGLPLTVQDLRDRCALGAFDPTHWNWCVSEELRLRGWEYTPQWSVWIMGTGAEQCYGVIWCDDEAEARAVCREFGIKPIEGVS